MQKTGHPFLRKYWTHLFIDLQIQIYMGVKFESQYHCQTATQVLYTIP